MHRGRVRHVHSRNGTGIIESADLAPGHRGVRIVLARQHDGDHRIVGELDGGLSRQVTHRRRVKNRAERRQHTRQNHLRLGVAKARVEFDHANARGRDNEPTVKEADKRGALALELAHHRQCHRLDALAREGIDAAKLIGQPR